MAAETIRIEIPVEMVDKTEPELSNIIKKISKFDQSTEKTQKSLEKWSKEKYEVFLEAKERISPIIGTLGSRLRNIAGKTWNVTMKAADFVTAPVRGILNLLKNPVFQVGAALGVSVGLKDTIDTYKDFEAAMSKVQAISGAAGSDLTKLTDKAKEMGATTKFTAQESAEAFNYMAMAGWKTDDMLGGIEGILSLAAASGEDLAITSDIVTDSLTAFGMKASDAGHFADVMAVAASNANTTVSGMGETFKYAGAMAGTLGYSIEDVALATGLMANAGIKGNMAGTALNSIFTRLSTNTNGATDALKNLGIEYFNADGSARDFSDVMKELRDATAAYTDEQKANLGNTIAGTYAQKGFLAILNATTEDYEKLSDAVNDADGAAAKMAEIMMDNLEGSITLLQSAADSVKLSFGERIAPYVGGIAKWFTDRMPEIEAGLDELMDYVDKKVEKLQAKFQEVTASSEWQNADFFGKVKIAWNEFIVEPFSEWWNGTGKAAVADIAANIGSGIGSGLKHGILALLGIDMSATINEASSIGSSFARGFSEGFDFDLIKPKLWEGFKNLISDAGKLLPGGESAGLSSVISAALLAKLASPIFGIGRGAFSLGKAIFATPAGGGTSIVSRIIGSTGNAMVGGSGLLGSMADVGYALTGGAASSTLSGGAAALAGTASVAGALAAGATLISSATDAYKAIKSDSVEESAAYGESAAWKAGGVAAGAAAGAALGSIIPGLGTAVGALVGAGVGGIAGWIKGNKIKEEYQDNVEEMQKELEKAQKVFEATGLSIDDVKFKNRALTQAMNDSEVSAEEFALMFQENCAEIMKNAFGDVKLSLAEIKDLAEKITFGDMKEGLEAFNTAVTNTENAFSILKNSISDLKKQNWRVGLGIKLSEIDLDNYKQSVDTFMESVKSYVENSHYEASVAVNLILGDESTQIDVLNDSYYKSLEEQINILNQQLKTVLDNALQDGVISTEKIRLPDGTLQLSEAEEIKNLQSQIIHITDKISTAQSEAEFQSLGIKYSGAELDAESFASMQEELKANVESMMETYDNALTVTLANLNMQLDDEAISQETYDALVKEATEGYQAQISELNARVEKFNLDSISEAWATELDGILPNMEGDLSERMSEAMRNAIAIDPDVEGWTREDVRKWFGLDNIDGVVFENIFEELQQTALTIPKQARDEMLKEFQSSVMSDFGPISNEDYKQVVEAYTSGLGTAFSGADFSMAGSAVSSGVGNAITNADRAEINSAVDVLKSDTDSYVNTAFGVGVFATMPVNIVAEYILSNPNAEISVSGGGSGTTTITTSVSSYAAASQGNTGKHAAGGFVTGKQLSWLAEEGYGEFVIPTNPSRRTRALELYEQAGNMLGVGAHAAGGFVGGSRDVFPSENYAARGKNKGNEITFYGNNENTGKNSSSSEMSYYDSGSFSTPDTVGNGMPIQIDVNMSPEINIQVSEGGDAESIADAVMGRILGMTDDIGGEMASRLMDVFSNMPMEGV